MEIAPHIPENLPFAKGSIVTPKGKITVSWKKNKGKIFFEVTVPEGVAAEFVYGNTRFTLQNGKIRISLG